MRLFASFTVDPASHWEKHRQNRQAGCEDSRQEGGRVPGTESGEAGAASRPAAAEGSPARRTGRGGTRNRRGNHRPLALIHPAGGPRPCPTNIELSAGWPLAESRARHSAIWSIAPGRIRRSQVGCIRSEHPRRGVVEPLGRGGATTFAPPLRIASPSGNRAVRCSPGWIGSRTWQRISDWPRLSRGSSRT